MSGKVSRSWRGRICEPHPATGGSPRILPTCRRGSSNRSVDRPSIWRARHCGSSSMALKIQPDAASKITGVVYADEAGKTQRQKARIVAVAGNSIESPRLLLNSASNMFPDGLANSSGQVGRNYMRHMTGSVYAVFDRSVHMYRGTTMAGIIRDEARHDPSRGFMGGYEMETLSLGLPFMAAFLNPGAWGRPFTAAMEGYPRMAGMWLVGEGMPPQTNRATLEPQAND